ncbi:alpha,alpha-trehalose-phosphate synthase (UDP-forming) [Gaiella sp.]|uniref:alpha,alpha-trehalose-phosphate synthase (UDP-forming) n=1 Tax=Gaiella sp. TaxID=2663207 RepID=UPI002E3228E4|nr:trehalose-6-phosphate synthase [Gaiella sp.]HEX5585013.1 trehalose-6-phosphate synthase [Gaiella sp.]
MRDPLVLVSNRGPVGFRRNRDGALDTVRGAGGLVAALGPLVDRHDVAWVASAMGDVERDIAAQGTRDERSEAGSDFRLRLVTHDPDVYADFYTVLANPVLWFVQHGLWDLKQDPGADLTRPWEAYVAVNRTLAAAAVEELDRRPGAPLFVQDYHLYRAPAQIRQARPEARIAHFVHIPWVGPDAWSVLPRPLVNAVHEGLLACDSVGFHTERWRAAFVECCEALLGRGAEAEQRTHANPIAVDAEGFAALGASVGVDERREALREHRPEVLILRVDRTDPSKNAVRGFEAFGLLLERDPSLHGRVELLALLDPSRQQIPEYAAYRRATEEAAETVNARFARPGWNPIRLDVRDDFLASLAAYHEFDVLLVNPVMDGLNLVAKEAPLLNERDGVLVLSRQAGAYEEIGEWTIGVDPLDVPGQAEALARALVLPAPERRRRLERIRASARSHDLDAWAERELAELEERAPAPAR